MITFLEVLNLTLGITGIVLSLLAMWFSDLNRKEAHQINVQTKELLTKIEMLSHQTSDNVTKHITSSNERLWGVFAAIIEAVTSGKQISRKELGLLPSENPDELNEILFSVLAFATKPTNKGIKLTEHHLYILMEKNLITPLQYDELNVALFNKQLKESEKSSQKSQNNLSVD